MGLRWAEWRDGSWRGWEDQWLAGTVATYQHSQLSDVDESGLRHLVITESFWLGFIAGDRVGGEYASPAETMAAVDAAWELRSR